MGSLLLDFMVVLFPLNEVQIFPANTLKISDWRSYE